MSSCPTTRLPPCSHLLFRLLTLLDPAAKIKPAPSSEKQVAHQQASSHSPSQMPSFPRCISISLPRQHPRLSHGAHSHKHLLPFSLPLYSPLCLPDRIHIAEEESANRRVYEGEDRKKSIDIFATEKTDGMVLQQEYLDCVMSAIFSCEFNPQPTYFHGPWICASIPQKN